MDIIKEKKSNFIPGYEDRKVLIVEDEDPYRRFLTKLIEKYLHAEVGAVPNPKEAFDYLNHTIPDLIIMDLQMPFMDGMTALKYIRANEKTANIPVIICSALGFESVIKSMNLYNVSDFILKPADAQLVIKKIIKSFTVQLKND
ncbi:MAG: response regulator [Candidatus Kapaibacterium sp.]